MKDFFTPMKIPQKWVCLLAMSFVFGQQAFSSENYVTESIAVSADIMQQKSKTVVGTVTDNGEPIIGASVVVKNAGKGVITDMDGNFKLDVPVGATIVISYVGYDSKEIVYKGESTLKVELSEDVLQLQEVQVVAYGVTKKVTVTGAISSVGTEEILKSPVSSISNALTGKLPGLSTVQQTGQPGADDATMYVRGVGSLTEGLSSPLVLVDGVERSFNQLDPNEIEDISILKDASSTAVFGVRGANGVILVTTKRGQEGKPKINVSTSYSLQMPTRMPEFANSYEYASTYVNAQRRDGIESNFAFTDEAIEAYRTHSNPLAYPDTDWVDMLIKDVALQTQHNFSISGGTRGVRYFASLGVLTQDGLFKSFEKEYDGNFKYNRYNYRINLDLDLTKTTLMRMNLGGRVNDKRTPNYEGSSDIGLLFRDIYWAIPMSGVGIMDGKWIWPDTKEFSLPGTVRDGLYPYYGKGYNTSAGNILNFDFMLEQKLNFITKGLKAHVKASYNSGVTLKKLRKTSYPHYETIVNEDGTVNLRKVGDQTNLQYSESTSRSRDWYMEVAMNYKRDFGDHHVSALAMYNQTMKYYPDSNPDEFKSIPRSYIGLVGRATYDWKTRYMVEMNVGYNGSENFAPGKRFGLFPAVSAGWVLTEENFMQPLKPWLSYFKLRASYGVVGNDRVSGNYRFLYLPDSYNPSTGSYYFGNSISTAWQGAVESKIGNPDVTWETAAKQNYGVDAYFINSKLKVNFDYFIERRKDILTNRKVLPTYLAANLPIANIGKVDNKGYELSVNWRDRIHDFRYHIGFNLAYAKNKIVFQDEVPYPYDYMRKTGKPVGQQMGYKYDGFFSEEDVAKYETERGKSIPDHGTGYIPKPGDVKYKDLNNDHKIDQYDVAAIGYPVYPLLTGGINLGFSYKGFDFSMTWSGATKVSRLLDDIFREPFGATDSRSLMKYMIDDMWTPEKGNSAKAPAISFTNKVNNYRDSDLWLRDASYLRLKNVEIGYNFPKKILSKINIGSLRVFATGYNLLTLDKLKIVDPESRPNGNAMYPVVLVINMGLKVGF